jgi:hypothetical protein
MLQLFTLFLTILTATVDTPAPKPEVKVTGDWVRDEAARTPPNFALFRHPRGGLLAMGLTNIVVNRETITALARTLLDEPSIEVLETAVIDPSTDALLVTWQKKSKGGGVIAKGCLALGSVPGLVRTPLMYVYRGEWPPQLNSQFGRYFLKAFLSRNSAPFYLP